ncbi:YchJ family protein [Kocuria sp.]|uniref:YchJ family protein n=1 Tax=Kocuria sp. TaxID=1871328 RepID=UPI0026E0EB9C|nr:YchJ family metal-binding protein [Kocuria sp.]MDO5619220.1 YchJ family metal-binding protein [Kocuria sp.]
MPQTTAQRSAALDADTRCPCGSGDTYGNCCRPFHHGKAAPTAETLMRSRFSAFAVGDEAHLLRTWDPSTRPDSVDLDPDLRWYRLDINGTTGGGPFEDWGTVDFTAHYKPVPGSQAPRGTQRENSRFRRHDGQWFYLDGTLI